MFITGFIVYLYNKKTILSPRSIAIKKPTPARLSGIMAPKRFNFTEQTIDDGACLICTNVKRHAPSRSPLSLLGNPRPIRKTLEDFSELKCTSRLLVNFGLSKCISISVSKPYHMLFQRTYSNFSLSCLFFCRFGRTHSRLYKFCLTNCLLSHWTVLCIIVQTCHI